MSRKRHAATRLSRSRETREGASKEFSKKNCHVQRVSSFSSETTRVLPRQQLSEDVLTSTASGSFACRARGGRGSG